MTEAVTSTNHTATRKGVESRGARPAMIKRLI